MGLIAEDTQLCFLRWCIVEGLHMRRLNCADACTAQQPSSAVSVSTLIVLQKPRSAHAGRQSPATWHSAQTAWRRGAHAAAGNGRQLGRRAALGGNMARGARRHLPPARDAAVTGVSCLMPREFGAITTGAACHHCGRAGAAACYHCVGLMHVALAAPMSDSMLQTDSPYFHACSWARWLILRTAPRERPAPHASEAPHLRHHDEAWRLQTTWRHTESLLLFSDGLVDDGAAVLQLVEDAMQAGRRVPKVHAIGFYPLCAGAHLHAFVYCGYCAACLVGVSCRTRKGPRAQWTLPMLAAPTSLVLGDSDWLSRPSLLPRTCSSTLSCCSLACMYHLASARAVHACCWRLQLAGPRISQPQCRQRCETLCYTMQAALLRAAARCF